MVPDIHIGFLFWVTLTILRVGGLKLVNEGVHRVKVASRGSDSFLDDLGGFNKLHVVGPSQSLRVVHLGKFYPPATGGIETHLETLAQAQAGLGADVSVVCVNHKNSRGEDITFRLLGSTPTSHDRDGVVKICRVGRQASLARFDVCAKLLPELWKILKGKPDVIHLHVPNPTMLLALAAIAPRCPVVITHHSDVVRQKVLSRLIRPFEHIVFRKAAAVLASSPLYPTGSELLQAYERKVHILPFGIDLSSFLNPNEQVRSHARRFVETHGEPIWLAVGRLVYYKGLENGIKALPHVPGKLLVVGEGPLKESLQELASEEGVADRVIWMGRISQDELLGAYQAATALWFPSNARSEAFGFVQIEAMASGCPVINTNIAGSGVPWVSRHEESGLTVPINDPMAFAGAANRLLNEAGLRERLASQARERACREFDHQMMGQRSLDLYRDIAERKQSGVGTKKRGGLSQTGTVSQNESVGV
ncbi:MAG: glycosyltransferase [Gemmataceae bacterium]